MDKINLPSKKRLTILALGAESAGNFSAYKDGVLYCSEDFGDLLAEPNFARFQQSLQKFIQKNNFRPDVILSDLHPLFLTTRLAKKLAKKYGAEYISVQHHLAHIFSALGDQKLHAKSRRLESEFLGIACDGTGYGTDGKIWGGEIFHISLHGRKSKIQRVAHLENQLLLGAESAIREPGRMLIAILSNFLEKEAVYGYVKKYYTKNDFAVLYSQWQQKFNCPETSSTARVLDAAAVLLGFSPNERRKKHGPSEMLEKNSNKPYPLQPQIMYDEQEKMFILLTTPLFEFLIKNIHKDKKRLAATAQNYLAQGLGEIAGRKQAVYFAGGLADNKILSAVLKKSGAYTNKKIPRGDVGISFGQIIYFLLADPRD